MRSTVRWLCVFALGVAAGVALASLSRGRPAAPRFVERAAGFAGPVVRVPHNVDPVVAERLAEPLPPVRYEGLALDGVIDNIRSTSGTGIFVNWPALQSAGVRRDLPVTLALPRQSLRDRLDQVLRAVGGDRMVLGATVDEGVVSISTGEDLAKNVATRVYDVRHLVRPDHRKEDLAAVLRLVQGIDPLSWKSFGGGVGNVAELSGQLIVTQSPAGHDRIAAVLAEAPALAPVPPGPPLATQQPATQRWKAPRRRPNVAGGAAPTTLPAPGVASHNAPQF